MSIADEVIKLAVSQIGVKEYPANSNNVLYNTEYYGGAVNGSGYAWCCAFVWWLFKHTGHPELFYGGNKTASCTTLMKYYKNKGQIMYKPKVGAIVFYQFDDDNYADHVGIVESVFNGGITAIEGNTGIGNEANGGAVMRRPRSENLIYCYAWPYPEEKEAQKTQETKQEAKKMTQEEFNKMFAVAMDNYLSQQVSEKLPAWAEEEFKKAMEAGITDGTRPMQFIPRYQAALMAYRAKEK